MKEGVRQERGVYPFSKDPIGQCRTRGVDKQSDKE